MTVKHQISYSRLKFHPIVVNKSFERMKGKYIKEQVLYLKSGEKNTTYPCGFLIL